MESTHLEDIIAGPVPQQGDTVSRTRSGKTVAMRVTAIWHSTVESGSVAMVEAQDV